MLKILVPVDGSENSARAVEYVIGFAAVLKDKEIHVITVRDPMDSLQVHRFWTDEQIHALCLIPHAGRVRRRSKYRS